MIPQVTLIDYVAIVGLPIAGALQYYAAEYSFRGERRETVARKAAYVMLVLIIIELMYVLWRSL